jgi:SAM-dependent methyltransferase
MTDRLPGIAASTGVDEAALRARRDELARAADWEAVVRVGRFEYLAPADAASVPLPDGAIDLYYSTCVLEHVPEGDLPAVHRETARLLAPGGLAYHIIDLSDHFAHGDSSIHRLNFLRFADEQWRRLGQNRLFLLNRLRAPDMTRLIAAAGLRVVHLETQADEGDLAFVRGLPLPPRFARLTAEENAVHLCHLLAEKG